MLSVCIILRVRGRDGRSFLNCSILEIKGPALRELLFGHLVARLKILFIMTGQFLNDPSNIHTYRYQSNLSVLLVIS